MRRYATLIAAAALAVPAPVVMSAPAQAGFNGIPDFCKDYLATGADPATNRGECISLLTQQFHYLVDDKNHNAYAVHACEYYADAAPEFFNSLWDSKQECMDEILDL